jgi:hypothetical protein
MAQANGMMSDLTQSVVVVVRSAASIRASEKAVVALSNAERIARKRARCKTCAGRGCTGRCRF